MNPHWMDWNFTAYLQLKLVLALVNLFKSFHKLDHIKIRETEWKSLPALESRAGSNPSHLTSQKENLEHENIQANGLRW